MASEVDICNLALGHLGDRATVSSIDPPEGSAQAEHCARFYPVARDALLAMHAWAFATKRIAVAAVTAENPEWDYAYAEPANLLKILAVLPADSTDDSEAAGQYLSQPYALESGLILTDQAGAIVRYTERVTDPTRFTPLFTDALAYMLASYLAGPIIKGKEGIAVGQSHRAMAMAMASAASGLDANHRRVRPAHNVPWLVGR